MTTNLNIIEYIGRDGVRTTNHTVHRVRMQRPAPGDLLRIPPDLQKYPFSRGEWGRIEKVHDDGSLFVCCEQGSCFLDKDHVLISGGPFTTVKPEWIEPEMSLAMSKMWNWGDNTPGGDQGVEYHIMRPVFRLTKFEMLY